MRESATSEDGKKSRDYSLHCLSRNRNNSRQSSYVIKDTASGNAGLQTFRSPIFRCTGDAVHLLEHVDLGWYEPWLSRQIRYMPYALQKLRVGTEELLHGSAFERVFTAVENYMRSIEEHSIDDIIQHLRGLSLLQDREDVRPAQRLLIFAILGWQSMLYLAGFNICSDDELAIHQDSTQPHSDLIFDVYKVSADLAERPLWVLLKGFGNLLPARSDGRLQVATEKSKLASSWIPLYPDETNAYFLQNLLHVHIRWVDTLSLHLDYDKSSRTLSVFSCPSFCVGLLESRGTLYSFSCPPGVQFDPRGDKEDISQFLKEVLLSYRLLFGQSAPSRKLFRHTFRPIETLGNRVDSLLPFICTEKQIQPPLKWIPEDRSIYFTARDFPVLYERIELIVKELKDAKPKSMGELLRDRRDTLQYWTFWLVSIIGVISILLSFIQVILQAVQLVKS